MPTNRINRIVQHLRRTTADVDAVGPSDGQLLESFLGRSEQNAFEAIVRRHGPMVLGVCRRILGHAEDAEDAFQAAFLVLARRAASIRRRESLAGWLYRVTYRAALVAKGKAAQRRSHEKQASDMPHPAIETPVATDELSALLDQELSRLPDKYRLPIILCELEGRSRRDVARQLKLPEGTLSSRLATARKLLRQRLGRRGLSAAGAALAALWSPVSSAASPGLPPALVSSLAQAATAVAAGNPALAAAVSSQVECLMQGVLRSMFLTNLKIGAAILLAAMLATSGTIQALTAVQEGPERPDRRAQADEKEKGAGGPVGSSEILKAAAPAAPAKKDGAEGEKKLAQSGKYTEPAWGEPKNGLRIGLCQTEAKPLDKGKFMAVLENVGGDDLLLQLGVMLANGKRQFPSALHMSFNRFGVKRTWQAKLKFVAGRLDPLVVPLGAGCRYALPLVGFDDEDPAQLGVPLKTGKYEVEVEFVADAAKREGDIAKLPPEPYWAGAIKSAPLEFDADDSLETKFKRTSVEQLVAELKSAEGDVRVAATRELFDRGKQALPELKKAGAKNIGSEGTIASSRLDAVFSLIQGLTPSGKTRHYANGSFGLNLQPGTTTDEFSALAKKYDLEPLGKLDFEGQPNCYVAYKSKSLPDVLKRLLTEAPLVMSVSLNYVER
jgi:RNA polymerase sigma factor (sigma-70 family)